MLETIMAYTKERCRMWLCSKETTHHFMVWTGSSGATDVGLWVWGHGRGWCGTDDRIQLKWEKMLSE